MAALTILPPEGLDGAGNTGPSKEHGWKYRAKQINDLDETVRMERTNSGKYLMIWTYMSKLRRSLAARIVLEAIEDLEGYPCILVLIDLKTKRLQERYNGSQLLRLSTN